MNTTTMRSWVAETGSAPVVVAIADVVDGLVHRVYIFANPDKLRGVASARAPD